VKGRWEREKDTRKRETHKKQEDSENPGKEDQPE
jgi:hypothetical protein